MLEWKHTNQIVGYCRRIPKYKRMVFRSVVTVEVGVGIYFEIEPIGFIDYV